jgi:hypothetical protein
MNAIFLRRVLAFDALSCAAMGIVMTPAAGTVAPLFGLPEGLIRGAGLLLLPLAAFIGWLATRTSPPRLGVWIVIVGNTAWAAESLVLVGASAQAMTGLGIVVVAAQAIAVLGLALLEYAGLRRLASVQA